VNAFVTAFPHTREMQPPHYDSTRWTGDPPPADQSRWTAQVGQPFVPAHLQRLTVPGYAPDELRAKRHAALLVLSTVLLWLSGVIVHDTTSDFLIEAPPITSLWPAPLSAGLALWFLADKGVMTNVCRWFGRIGWIAVVMAALIYPATAIYAHGEAAFGPEMRSQIANIRVEGHEYHTTTITTLALEDGGLVATAAYPGGDYGSMGRCLAVRRLIGPLGFSWLQIRDAAPLPPAPGPGQLHWPVEPVSRADCFSGKPLSELRGTA
jgi:hypothetical protein